MACPTRFRTELVPTRSASSRERVSWAGPCAAARQEVQMPKAKFLFPPALAVIAACVLWVIGPVSAQEAGSGTVRASPEGVFTFQGGPLWIMLARTQTSPTTIPKSSGWTNLPSASLSWTVFPGMTALFNVSFSAECMMSNAAGSDWVNIRVLANGIPMEPSEPVERRQQFCSAPGTYTGEWTKRLSGAQTITVQLYVADAPPFGNVSVTVDDWSLQLAAHQ